MIPTNESTLKQVIEELIESYRLKDGLTTAKLVSSWEKIAGSYISERTEKIFVRGNKLFLKLNSPALKSELSFAKSKLIKSLNDAAGREVITEIVFL
jgi:hypothetical protein